MYFLYLIEFVFIIIYIYGKLHAECNSFEHNILGGDRVFQTFNYNTNTSADSVSTVKCEETNGRHMVLMKSDGVDAYECVSIYPTIFDNNGRAHDHVCKNGHINYGAGSMSSDFCVCDRLEYTKIFLYGAPVCVKNPNLYK